MKMAKVFISLRVLNILHSTHPLSAAILFFSPHPPPIPGLKEDYKFCFGKQWWLLNLSYLGISLLHLRSGHRNISMEYCSGNSTVGTLFHSTGRTLGVYFQFLDQSRHGRMPSPLFVKERNNSIMRIIASTCILGTVSARGHLAPGSDT